MPRSSARRHLRTNPPTVIGGSIVTAGGLIFIGATNDGRFRAFDKDAGKLLWETRLPASAFANPMTYMGSNKQFVVIAAGGGNKYDKKLFRLAGCFFLALGLPAAIQFDHPKHAPIKMKCVSCHQIAERASFPEAQK